MLKNNFLAGFILALAFLSQASSARAGEIAHWGLVGQGSMKFAFLEIYNAQLFARDGKYRPGQPFALEIEYLRNIKKSRLIKETINQWKHIGLKNHPSAKDWVEQLEKTWSDIRASDKLTMIVSKDQHTTFLLNGTTLGAIKDPEFSIAFASIWLSTKTSRPELREQLLGAN